MNNKLYRFMSFSKFVDMVLTENLVLVSPTIWDDPFELEFFTRWSVKKAEIDRVENPESKEIASILSTIISFKIFAMSWTRLAESDALWRIYSDNNQSIRISVFEDKLASLKNCLIRDVNYSDSITDDELLNTDFDALFAIKRKAFEHEKEVILK